ncbi:hypothetical protein AX15_000202 [Amanita polypyramis BW_CC]|nr:hypothetical protein AX15_000202 [Amanita polypyramis BW_CC]
MKLPPLLIDLADSDPYLEGKTTVRGELVDSGPSEQRGWRVGGKNQDPNAFLASVPPGVQLPKNMSALDHISQTLASMSPSHLMEVLAQMKAFVITYPEQARTLLVSHPQLAYALFQALLLNKIVDSAILQRMLEATVASAQAPAAHPTAARPVPPPHLQHPMYSQMPYGAPPLQQPQPVPGMPPPPPPPMSVPPPGAMFPHHQPPPGMPPMPPYYRPLPPPTHSQVPPAQPSVQMSTPQSAPQSTPDISESQRSMLMQVLSLTQEQINVLPETERQAIVQLVRLRITAALNGPFVHLSFIYSVRNSWVHLVYETRSGSRIRSLKQVTSSVLVNLPKTVR